MARLRMDSSAGVVELSDGAGSATLSFSPESRTPLDAAFELSPLVVAGVELVFTGVEVLLNKLLKLSVRKVNEKV